MIYISHEQMERERKARKIRGKIIKNWRTIENLVYENLRMNEGLAKLGSHKFIPVLNVEQELQMELARRRGNMDYEAKHFIYKKGGKNDK